VIPAPGCQFVGNDKNVYQDFKAMPSQDIYGNQTFLQIASQILRLSQ